MSAERIKFLSGRMAHFRGAAGGMMGPSIRVALEVPRALLPQWADLPDLMPFVFEEDADALKSIIQFPQSHSLNALVRFTILALRSSQIPVAREYGILAEHPQRNIYKLTLPVIDGRETIEALKYCLGNLHLNVGQPIDQSERVQQLRNVVSNIRRVCTPFALGGQNKSLIVLAAQELGVPILSIQNSSVVLGLRQNTRKLQSTYSDVTPAISVDASRDKVKANRLLRQNGFPVVDQFSVRDVEQATSIASSMGLPVVIKPADLDGGVGVHAGLVSMQGVRDCFVEARRYSQNIILEKFASGISYRFTFHEKTLLTATMKRPGGVVGDGVSTFKELIEATHPQEDPRFSPFRPVYPPLRLDEEARTLLFERNADESDIPIRGEFVPLRRRTNAVTGGQTLEVELDQIHPDNIDLCRDAVKLFGLDIAGVDFISQDISRPWYQTKAVICEINGQPQMGFGAVCDLLKAFDLEQYATNINLLLVNDQDSDNVDLCRLVMSKLNLSEATVASGFVMPDEFIRRDFMSGFDGVLAGLSARRTGAFLGVMTYNEFNRYGLPFNRFEKIILSSIAAPDRVEAKALRSTLAQYCCECYFLGSNEVE